MSANCAYMVHPPHDLMRTYLELVIDSHIRLENGDIGATAQLLGHPLLGPELVAHDAHHLVIGVA